MFTLFFYISGCGDHHCVHCFIVVSLHALLVMPGSTDESTTTHLPGATQRRGEFGNCRFALTNSYFLSEYLLN